MGPTNESGAHEMKLWVITSGKGTVYVTRADTLSAAVRRFQIEYPSLHVASIVEAENF